MKKDTTQPPTEKPITEKPMEKTANVIVFDDGYVTIAIDPAHRKALKIGDRVKNAIKAMIKEGYSVQIQKIKQSEIPF